jgi:Meiotically Up-regulated Gene 113 (MUG113) protein
MRDQIISEIRRIANEDGGKAPGIRAFERLTGIREASWRGIYWARWGDALTEAGFAANEWQGKHDSEFVLLKLIEACRHYGRIPTVDELKIYARTREGFPSSKAMYQHFGSKEALLQNLRAWLADKNEFADVASMLGTPATKDGIAAPNQQEGLVYLIKSGAHYKIGRSGELERRVKEIRVALPEAATLVHSIRTDDPAGIEAYWHRRFGDKRANGEWFKLTSADVTAFKRRKFQ